MAARMVGHQKAAAKGADHLHAVAGFQITQIVGSHAFDGLTLVVLHHTLDGEREVVVTRTFTVAWAGDGILTGMVRLAVGVHARRDDAHRLPFQHRKRQAAKVEHDVVGFVVGAGLVDLHIAYHLGADGRLGAVQIGCGLRCRARRHIDFCRCGRGYVSLALPLDISLRRRQFIPRELLGHGVGFAAQHRQPMVDGARGTRWHTGHAVVANVYIHHIVAAVVRDRAHRAGGLAGVATYAHLGVNHMLLQQLGGLAHV